MPYDNRRREEGARTTRARVLEAARASFLAAGFGATTIRQVAADAGVSQETVYKTFGSKAALLKAVYDVALAGDDEAVPLAARPELAAVREATSPEAAARAYAELGGLIAGRIDPLLRVLLGSRDTDPVLTEFARTTDQERRVGSEHFVRSWVTRGWIDDDAGLDRAVDAVWALNSAELRWLLLDRGWTAEEYTRWLAAMIRGAILHEAG